VCDLTAESSGDDDMQDSDDDVQDFDDVRQAAHTGHMCTDLPHLKHVAASLASLSPISPRLVLQEEPSVVRGGGEVPPDHDFLPHFRSISRAMAHGGLTVNFDEMLRMYEGHTALARRGGG
jgi:hypothetical protein